MKLNFIHKINNQEEDIVFRNLKCRGFFQINYEPEGQSKIPDFSAIINNKLFAIEVRRLNQNVFCSEGVFGIEEDIKLQKSVENFLKSFGENDKDKSWDVNITISRPTTKKENIEFLKKLRNQMLHINENSHGALLLHKEYGIEVKIYEGNYKNIYKFNFAVFHNQNEGGFIVKEIAKNINYCVKEKTKKMQNSTATYDVLELALVDEIGFQYTNIYSKENLHFIKNNIEKRIWNFITIINPKNYQEFHQF